MGTVFSKQNIGRFLLLSSALSFGVFLWFIFQSARYVDPKGVDLSGEWDFYNGKISLSEARAKNTFSVKVDVPRPLPEEIRKNLKEEFWFRKKINLSRELRESGEVLTLSLGNIKGEHEVYWNGKFLGAGAKSVLANYRLPEEYVKAETSEILVRVQKSNSLFPGIVQISPILVGRSSLLNRQLTDFYFQTGVKPLFPAGFKLLLFFLFLSVFCVSSNKKEYFTFSVFALISALESAMHSSFLPIFEDFYFKTSMYFLFSVCSLSMVPSLTVNFLRLNNEIKYWSRIYGYSLVIVLVGASVFLKNQEQIYSLHHLSNQWLPFLSLLPSAFVALYFSLNLAFTKKIIHRAVQTGIFSLVLFAGAIVWSSGAANLFQFKIYYPELLDILVFTGLTFCLLTDLHFISIQSERAGQMVPKWFSFLLSTRTENAVFEVPMVVMVVDTVAYTKNLVSMNKEGRGQYHANIRAALHEVLAKFSAQKISERGDGAIFAWELSSEKSAKSAAVAEALAAAKFLSEIGKIYPGLEFRVGMASGTVRCEWRSAELSFLGEAINAAARLEGLSKPNGVLIHESLAAEIEGGLLEQEWISVDLKGVTYRAKELSKAA